MSKKHLFPLLILSLVTCCIETEVSVPSFPNISDYFGVSDGAVQLTIAYNFLGLCLACFLYGPLSESYGRRPIMLIGNALMALGAVGCFMTFSMEFLYLSRFIQGVGAAASITVAFAMIADAYDEQQSTLLLGKMNAILTGSMAASPLIGGLLNEHLGWRGNYGFVAFFSILAITFLFLGLVETKKERSPFKVKEMTGGYKKLFSSFKFLALSSIPSIQCAAYLGFVTCSSFLYLETFNVSVPVYIASQICVVGSFCLGSYFSGGLIGRFGGEKILKMGTFMTLVPSITLFMVCLNTDIPHLFMTLMLIISFGGVALCYPVAFMKSMSVFTDLKGASSSAIFGMRMLILSIVIGCQSMTYDGTVFSVAKMILGCMILGGVIVLYTLKRGFFKDTPSKTEAISA